MVDLISEGEKNLILMHKLLPSNDRLSLWCYTADGRMLTNDCPEAATFGPAFAALGGMDRVLVHGRASKRPRPLLIGTAIGMQWAAAYECDDRGVPRLIFLLGPAFYRDLSIAEVREGLRQYSQAEFSLAWREQLSQKLDAVPVMSYAIFSRYAVMLHNSLNSEQLSALDLASGEVPELDASRPKRDRHKVWRAEQALLQMVRNGDIDYRDALQNSENLSTGVPVHGRDPLRQGKTSVTVFASIVTRAAIEGGLSPEEAYSLGDSYIQAAEDARDLAELSALASAMYDDFIHRVHRCRTNPDYSRQIQKCCDYIELNLDKPIRTADLAALVGYTDYYLTEKFKKETGLSISNYVKFAKVERAKVLLASGDESIQSIADKLAFNTPNYFIQSFRSVVGCTPTQYRRQQQK